MNLKSRLAVMYDYNMVVNRKLWSSGSVIGSRLEGCGIDPRPMLDVSGVKVMTGSIPAPNPGEVQFEQVSINQHFMSSFFVMKVFFEDFL